jgi:hypothetical protein
VLQQGPWNDKPLKVDLKEGVSAEYGWAGKNIIIELLCIGGGGGNILLGSKGFMTHRITEFLDYIHHLEF